MKVFFALMVALALTASACAPMACPGGYADKNWCTHNYNGGEAGGN